MELSTLLLAGRFLKTLTSCFTITYLVGFLPLSVILYALTPKKLKKYFLLIASFGFFWLISGTLIVYLFVTILSIHYFGLWLDRIQLQLKEELSATEKEGKKAVKAAYAKKQRWVIVLAVLVHIGTLALLKYSGFFLGNVNTLLSLAGFSLQIEIPKFLAPIGISFFTLQALSYILDVHRGVTKADDNIFRLALFVSFFPTLIEGPICRYQQTADQLWNAEQIKLQNLKFGLQRLAFGMMKKVVVADRLDAFVKETFTNYAQYEGGAIALAAVCYTIQLYMDFSGSMDAVIGTAQIFGITLPENFARPFFSKTVSEFWQRWHITLGAWLKDYVFYPISTSKKMKKLTSNARKRLGNHYGPLLAGSIALFCVWLSNGIWHGSGWNFVFFGMYHFAWILIGSLIAPPVKYINKKLHINPEWKIYKLIQILRTVVIVIIGEMFFRADGVRAGLAMFKKIVTEFTFENINYVNMTPADFAVVAGIVVIVLAVGILQEKGTRVREALAAKPLVVRWGLLYLMLAIIVIFGAYGLGYGAIEPMYAQF